VTPRARRLCSSFDHPSLEVQEAAVISLGSVGTARAVEPLTQHRGGILGDTELKRAVRDAIARIQMRLGPVDAGRLSLAEEDECAGALSTVETDEPAGALSVASERDPGN
jgi:hypothetical protein